jgi:selenocysteine-specific translation elongation factor
LSTFPATATFIENMLAGIGGIDAALLIIAADEGVMPQTREHLAILDLLQIQSGIIVITKTDLVDDAEWLDLLEEDMRRALAGTVLQKLRWCASPPEPASASKNFFHARKRLSQTAPNASTSDDRVCRSTGFSPCPALAPS